MKAIILDMDGTFVKSERFHTRAEIEVCRKYGLFMTKKILDQYRGGRTKDLIKDIIRWYGLRGVTAASFIREKDALFMAYAKGNLQLYPGFQQFLKRMAPQYQIAVATSSSRQLQQFVFGELGIHNTFKIVMTGDRVKQGKPDPEEFLKTMKALGVAPKDCVIIEDADNGIIAAKKAGAKAIGITNTLPATRLRQAKADAVVKRFSEITPLLLERLTKSKDL